MKQFAEFVEVEVVSNLRKENDYTLDEKIERLPAMFWKALISCHNEMESIWDTLHHDEPSSKERFCDIKPFQNV